jgi:hypothetical protein
MKSKISIIALLFLITTTVLSQDKKKVEAWVPMENRIKVWDAVVSRELGLPLPLKEPKPYRIENIDATFEKDGTTWTMMGAAGPIVNPTVYSKDWPVKGDGFEVLVIPEPITNDKILPFTVNIDHAIKSDVISITAARDSYEPASFVMRTGDLPLRNIGIEVDDLKAEVKDDQGHVSYSILPNSLIDIRVVKCWYQSGVTLFDPTHKILVPELLLHDDDVVRVDYIDQVNMIRNYKELVDSERLQPFSIPAKQNKQLWLTIHITKDIQPGDYKGRLQIKSDPLSQVVNLNVRVLPVILPPPVLDYALYYEGHLADSDDKPKVNWLIKTATQLKAELEDMIAHGLKNAPVWHQVNQDKAQWEKDWGRLRKTLDIRKELGWGNQPLLYLDWKVSFKEDFDQYKEKIKKIQSVAQEKGIKEVYIYGVDEKRGEELVQLKPLYKAVHEAGAKNFVAGQLNQFLKYADGLIDLMVISDRYSDANVKQIFEIKQQGNKVFSYANPQAGFEEPASYRQNYGINLYLSGFDGALNYNYQAGSWNDWADPSWKYRSHIMAYPTINKPIPTIQWEGWREGVNDVRFLSLALQIPKFDRHSLVGQSPKNQRGLLLKLLNY